MDTGLSCSYLSLVHLVERGANAKGTQQHPWPAEQGNGSHELLRLTLAHIHMSVELQEEKIYVFLGRGIL